jgi:hypothetical protein
MSPSTVVLIYNNFPLPRLDRRSKVATPISFRPSASRDVDTILRLGMIICVFLTVTAEKNRRCPLTTGVYFLQNLAANNHLDNSSCGTKEVANGKDMCGRSADCSARLLQCGAKLCRRHFTL